MFPAANGYSINILLQIIEIIIAFLSIKIKHQNITIHGIFNFE